MKILIIRFSSIGDIVLTTPVIRCIKQQVPDVELHYLTKSSFRPILEHNPYIDHLHLLEDNLDVAVSNLQHYKFDYIIDLHHNLRSLRVKRGLQAKAFAFNKLNVEKWLLTALKINRLPATHIVDRYLATAAPLGVKNDGRGLDYFIGPDEYTSAEDLPATHRAGYIAVVIGAALPTKKLPIEKLKDLCHRIQHPMILLGGPEDAADGDIISRIDPAKIYNACGRFKLNESADLVRLAKLVVTHDTGLMHIAAAFRRPLISLWGNTVPAFGMTPYFAEPSPAHQLFEVANLGCRPCSKIGHRRCPKGHFNCMNQLPIAAIAATVQQWLAGNGRH